MNILIINSYVRENTGDAAQLSITLKQLHKTFPKASIKIAGLEDPKIHPTFERSSNVGSMRLYSLGNSKHRYKSILNKLFVFIVGEMCRLGMFNIQIVKHLDIGIQNELLAIYHADLIISAGGGYLTASNSFAGNINIYLLTLPIRIARALGKPVIMAPQSFGPFGNIWQQKLVINVLNNSQLICIRENKSFQLLRTLGIKPHLLHKFVDLGFSTKSKLFVVESNRKRMIIGMTARQWFSTQKQLHYEHELAHFIFTIEKKYHAQVILIPQVTSSIESDDDRIVETRIYNQAKLLGGHPKLITRTLSHSQIRKYYSKLDYIIGTRFHSVIFSLTNLVPAIAIEYEPKTSAIMNDLHLNKWVININKISRESLNNLFEILVSQNISYKKHLINYLPRYTKVTNTLPRVIKYTYNRFSKSFL